LKKLGTVLDKTAKLTAILVKEAEKKDEKEREQEISEMHSAARRALVDLYEVVMHDFITDQNLRFGDLFLSSFDSFCEQIGILLITIELWSELLCGYGFVNSKPSLCCPMLAQF
jgi:hypothetical protein